MIPQSLKNVKTKYKYLAIKKLFLDIFAKCVKCGIIILNFDGKG